MALLGRGVVLLWCDIAPEAADEHELWHSNEHIPERLGVPGYLRVRRGISSDLDVPRIFVLYEVRDLGVVVSPAYMERLNNPSAWTTKMMRSVKRLNRTPCTVTASFGAGIGAHIATIRLTPHPESKTRLREWLVSEALPNVARLPGTVGVHLLEADAAARGLDTKEQMLRGQRDAAADWVIVVDGFDQRAIYTVTTEQLGEKVLEEHGASTGTGAIYQLVHVASASEIAATSARPVPP